MVSLYPKSEKVSIKGLLFYTVWHIIDTIQKRGDHDGCKRKTELNDALRFL